MIIVMINLLIIFLINHCVQKIVKIVKNDKNFPESKVMSSYNCPKSKDPQFTVMYDTERR